LVTDEPRRRAAALELLSWLSDPTFLGGWTQALGLLPADGPTLDAWEDGAEKSLVMQLTSVTRASPPMEIRVALGAAIRNSIDAVLSGQLTPSAAALAAVQALPQP
jgi:ABC-type glycerol-3-phosphate transport system substrate-binding protein